METSKASARGALNRSRWTMLNCCRRCGRQRSFASGATTANTPPNSATTFPPSLSCSSNLLLPCWRPGGLSCVPEFRSGPTTKANWEWSSASAATNFPPTRTRAPIFSATPASTTSPPATFRKKTASGRAPRVSTRSVLSARSWSMGSIPGQEFRWKLVSTVRCASQATRGISFFPSASRCVTSRRS